MVHSEPRTNSWSTNDIKHQIPTFSVATTFSGSLLTSHAFLHSYCTYPDIFDKLTEKKIYKDTNQQLWSSCLNYFHSAQSVLWSATDWSVLHTAADSRHTPLGQWNPARSCYISTLSVIFLHLWFIYQLHHYTSCIVAPWCTISWYLETNLELDSTLFGPNPMQPLQFIPAAPSPMLSLIHWWHRTITVHGSYLI